MSKDIDTSSESNWTTGLFFLIGILGLSILIGLGIALFSDFSMDDPAAKRRAEEELKKTPRPETALTRVPVPYAPEAWPTYPGRTRNLTPTSRADTPASGGASGGSGAPTGTRQAEVPVGISPEEYQAAVAAGKKVYLPAPKGNCDIGGMAGGVSARALENCFAQQAAR